MDGHGIKKETYVNADEETTKALTFDLLDNLYRKFSDTCELQVAQRKTCNQRFVKLESGKKKDTAIASASGFGGGGVAVIVLWLKNKFLG